MSRRALTGCVLVALILAALVLHARQSSPKQAPAPHGVASKTYEQLAAANYRTLTPAQSTRLLRFATAFRTCMNGRGIGLSAPRTSLTRILLRVEAKPLPATIRSSTVACGDRLGGPPAGSSLQTPRAQAGLIVLYLPKQCLLDPTVTSG